MIQKVTMYRVVCDEPGCDGSAQDGGDFYAWLEPDKMTYDDAENAGWQTGRGDGPDYCEDHRRTGVES